MDAGVFAVNAISALLLPPLNLLLLCAAGLILRHRSPRIGMLLSVGALLLLLVLSTKAGSMLLVAPLEKRTKWLTETTDTRAQAIVVLGGGRLANALEYGGGDQPSIITLARLRYAARLHRETGLPLLVTGGAPDGAEESEAAAMARTLQEDFTIPVKWMEERSNNTAENARLSAAILQAAGIQRILLVTDAMHMPRSRAVFEKNGLEVTPAPTISYSLEPLSPLHFLPGGEGMRRSHYAAHEWVGMGWYLLRH